MKDTMKKIHLYTGLGLLAFMLMYFVSGFVLIEHKLFPNSDPDKRTRMVQVSIPDGLDADRQRVVIETTDNGFRGMMVGYHRMHGYNTNFVWTLWAVMYDLASAGCIAFAISGIWIWAAVRDRDRTSWVMLIFGWGFTLSMVLYLMLTR